MQQLPAVDDLRCSSLESQGIREGNFGVQDALLLGLVTIHQGAVNVTLPLTDVLPAVSVALVSRVIVAHRCFNNLQTT